MMDCTGLAKVMTCEFVQESSASRILLSSIDEQTYLLLATQLAYA